MHHYGTWYHVPQGMIACKALFAKRRTSWDILNMILAQKICDHGTPAERLAPNEL